MAGDLFQYLLEETEVQPMTVSELNAEVRSAVERRFGSVWVEGEVVDFRQYGNGHWYFNLNDGTSSIKCICWGSSSYRIRFKPKSGVKVRIRGKITFWETKGELKLTVDSLEPSGEGALAAAYEQIKLKLEAEGLFANELKRPIPFMPRRVAVITSKSGAAYHDIHTVLTRRARSVNILLVNALVQGEGAADSLRAAVIGVNRYNSTLQPHERIDVLIIGRGGGSADDLWAFNDEALARALRASRIPVISAVGHEIDWTVSDLVSDMRAPTPSAAAEMVASREADILFDLQACGDRLYELIDGKIADADDRLTNAFGGLQANTSFAIQKAKDGFTNVSGRFTPEVVRAKAMSLSNLLELSDQRRISALKRLVTRHQDGLNVQMAKLDALSPLGVLTRGYSITQVQDGTMLRDAANVSKGDKLKIRVERGTINTEVLSTE
jgi:exodeoxyribonuclease VII large subunit